MGSIRGSSNGHSGRNVGARASGGGMMVSGLSEAFKQVTRSVMGMGCSLGHPLPCCDIAVDSGVGWRNSVALRGGGTR